MSREDDRDRPSWRERDAARNRSAHTQDERPSTGARAPRIASATAGYKRQLDALFDRGVVPDHLKEKLPAGHAPSPRQQRLRAIREATDVRALQRAVDDLRAADGLPDDDLDVLLRVLEHPDDAVLSDALSKLEAYVESGRPVERKARFVARLRNVEVSSFDPRVQARAGRLAARLR